MVVRRNSENTVVEVDDKLRPMALAIHIATMRQYDSAFVFSVEDADTGEVMWPKEEE